MAADKPRFSVTFTDEVLIKIQQYKKEHSISTQSKAVAQLVELALQEIETTTNKSKSPLYSSEAMELAESYDHQMDAWGRKAVQCVAATEIARYKEEQTRAAESWAELAEKPKTPKIPKAQKRGGIVKIKVYDQPAAAGLGNYLDDPDYHIEDYPKYIIPSGTDFGVLIDGDSMEPVVHHGFTVFVQSCSNIDSGQIGIFVLNDKAYCKRLLVDHEKRQIRLVSANKDYEDIVIGEYDSFRTLGRILGQWGPGSKEDDFLDWKG